MKYQFLLFLPLFVVGACSSGNDTPAPKTTGTETTGTETMSTETTAPTPGKVSSDNPFSAQINAIGAAKDVSNAANKTIDQHQQELDSNNP